MIKQCYSFNGRISFILIMIDRVRFFRLKYHFHSCDNRIISVDGIISSVLMMNKSILFTFLKNRFCPCYDRSSLIYFMNESVLYL